MNTNGFPFGKASAEEGNISVHQCPSVVPDPSLVSRRQFLNRFGMGLGGIALADMLTRNAGAAPVDHGVLGQPHFAPKARRIIYLFMSGGPSQLDLFDYKPLLNQRHGEQLPD